MIGMRFNSKLIVSRRRECRAHLRWRIFQHTFVETSQFIVTHTFWPMTGAIVRANTNAFVQIFAIAEVDLSAVAVWISWLSNARWWTLWIGASVCCRIIARTIFTFTIRRRINCIANRWTFRKRVHKWNCQTPNASHKHTYLLEIEI